MRSKFKFLLISAAFFTAFAGASAAPAAKDACALLTPVDIAKATGMKVASGIAGKPIPGILGKCTWTGQGGTRVIVTLADAQHIEIAIRAVENTGGQTVPGVGTKAVGIKGAPFTGGGYIVNVLDARGGLGVSILGQKGTRDAAIALAKMVESHR